MSSIQIRNLPEDLYAKLKAKAEEEQRTIPQQVIFYLKKQLEVPNTTTDPVEIRREVLNQLKTMRWPSSKMDIVKEIRRDRDER